MKRHGLIVEITKQESESVGVTRHSVNWGEKIKPFLISKGFDPKFIYRGSLFIDKISNGTGNVFFVERPDGDGGHSFVGTVDEYKERLDAPPKVDWRTSLKRAIFGK